MKYCFCICQLDKKNKNTKQVPKGKGNAMKKFKTLMLVKNNGNEDMATKKKSKRMSVKWNKVILPNNEKTGNAQISVNLNSPF